MSVPAVRLDDLDRNSPPGAFRYYGFPEPVPAIGRGMVYVCPCGCRCQGLLRFRPRSTPGPAWDWDGNIEQPTLTPSVHDQVHAPGGGLVTHWHGWLKGGTWTSC